jgi:hypothetical protein
MFARRESCLKNTPSYFSGATTPCVVAYGYYRIRRLVRLCLGVYRFHTTAFQWSGLVARGVISKVQKRCQSDFCLNLMVAVRRALRRAGNADSPRSTNLRTAATLL